MPAVSSGASARPGRHCCRFRVGSEGRRTADGARDHLVAVPDPPISADLTTWGIAMSMRTPNTRPIVVSGSHDATVRVWDLDSRGPLYEPLQGHNGNVLAVAIGELHGRPIAVSASDDFTLWGWDRDECETLGDT